MIRNIIFDMGGVLIRFDREFFIKRLGVDDGDGRILMNEVFRSLEWARLDRGSITEADAIDSICGRTPARLHDAVKSLFTAWERPILPIEGMYELVRELKDNGYGIYLLSNASIRQQEYWPDIPVSTFFDGTIISADVSLVKPQPEIFSLLCSEFSLLPQECFMIDDMPQNIEGAFEAKMPGFIFNEDVLKLRAAMKRMGIKVK